MKLSTITWFSKTIAIPLFIGVLNIAPAAAEQIARARTSSLDSLPSVTDLNLLIPAAANSLPSERSDTSNSNEPIWSNPKPTNLVPSIIREKTNKAKSPSLAKPIETGSINTNSLPLTRSKKSGAKYPVIATESTFNSTRKSKPKIIAAISPAPLGSNYLRLVRDPSNRTNDLGNPIYTLEAYVRGERYQTFTAVSGTVNTQNYNRNRGENAAPLPDGKYTVSQQIVPGQLYEVGKTFIGIYPEFATARTDLGIHLDRSFNQRNGYDGTAGCIGIATVAERDAINEFVTKYQPRNLFVKISSRS
jgi:hypothetical protein